jgi:hypothetical protein
VIQDVDARDERGHDGGSGVARSPHDLVCSERDSR